MLPGSGARFSARWSVGARQPRMHPKPVLRMREQKELEKLPPGTARDQSPKKEPAAQRKRPGEMAALAGAAKKWKPSARGRGRLNHACDSA